MYRAAVRATSRQARGVLRHQLPTSQCTSSASSSAFRQRFASSVSAGRSRSSWKGSALRWGLAVTAVYYYNTSPVFAEELTAPLPITAPPSFTESDLPTVDSVIEQKRTQLKAAQLDPDAATSKEKITSGAVERTSSQATSSPSSPSSPPPPSSSHSTAVASGSPEALEEEAGQEGAFNPETGEINWDCPCLGGMAHGPCGEEFKAAFSCFVHSSEEPKGMDCIDKFQGMQTCFRQHPDIYGAELDDVDGIGADPADGAGAEHQVSREQHEGAALKTDDQQQPEGKQVNSAAVEPAKDGESGVPKKWEDATDADAGDAKDGQPGKKAEKQNGE